MSPLLSRRVRHIPRTRGTRDTWVALPLKYRLSVFRLGRSTVLCPGQDDKTLTSTLFRPVILQKMGTLRSCRRARPNKHYLSALTAIHNRQQGELTHSQSRLLPLMPPSPTPRPNHAVDQARCRHSGQGPPPSHHDRPRLASGHRPPSALSPLAAAEVLCSGGSKCHLFKWVKARGK